jgi:hypothetical protein
LIFEAKIAKMKKILIVCAAFLTSFSKMIFGQEKPNILFVYIDDMATATFIVTEAG